VSLDVGNGVSLGAGIGVADKVGVSVGVWRGVHVTHGVALGLGVSLASGVAVLVGVQVVVGVIVAVLVDVGVGDAVGVGFTTLTLTAGEAALLPWWSKTRTRKEYRPFSSCLVSQAPRRPSSSAKPSRATGPQPSGLSPMPYCTS
jgi:hypothetical protein